MWVVLALLASAALQPAPCSAASSLAGAAQGSGVSVAEYKPERCAYCERETWCELRQNGKWQCRGCKIARYYEYFLYPPINASLLAWTDQVLRDLFGTIDMQTGLRKYRRAYISMGKQNGKSYLCGGLPVYHLDCENEVDPEVYGAASSKDQAGIVFKATAKIIRANPNLLAKFKVNDSVKKIIRRDGRGTYEVLSADGDFRDGIRGSLLIRDEIHRWKTIKAETLRDVLTKGQISRREPLDIQVTTAGAEYESPLWYGEYQFAKQVLAARQAGDYTFASDYYVAIWEADAKRVQEDPEYWKSKEARIAANPSHEDLGGHLRDAAIVAELNKAIANAAERSKYLRYHLNVPIQTSEDPVINIPQWQACGGGVDLRTWDAYEPDRLVAQWGLAGRQCWGGVDASWNTDLTAYVDVFPPFKGSDGQWTLLPFFWMPADRVSELERICRVPFATWIRQGFIQTTEGSAIDLNAVVDRIRKSRKQFHLREVPFDPAANFRNVATGLANEGVTAVEVPQVFLHLGAATKFLLGLYPDRNLRHGNNPVMNWMAACLQLQYDHKDNCQPSKPARGKSSKRIDGMQATVTALNRALLAQPKATYTGLRSVAC